MTSELPMDSPRKGMPVVVVLIVPSLGLAPAIFRPNCGQILMTCPAEFQFALSTSYFSSVHILHPRCDTALSE